jgi:galactose mutarotase-like enzyme
MKKGLAACFGVLLSCGAFYADPVFADQYSASRAGQLLELKDGQGLEASISPDHGGELSSLKVYFQDKWHELIYRAKDYRSGGGWRGKAPLLWPATGISRIPGEENMAGQYQLDNRVYNMPVHGFARHKSWQLDKLVQTDQEASASLFIEDDEQTRVLYPFGFRLAINYRLSDNRLSLNYTVEAKSSNSDPMPFSVGNHMTFMLPLIASSSIEDAVLETAIPLRLELGEGNIPTGSLRPFRQKIFPLRELPVRKPVSLGGLAGAPYVIVRDQSGFALKIVHEASRRPTGTYVQFNLWGDVENGFFSPEPWVGSQNSLNSGLGLVLLAPGESWSWQISITLLLPKGEIPPAAGLGGL